MKRRLEEALALAEELLADVELSRVTAEQALLKAVRLARLASDETTMRWLEFELQGYEFTNESRDLLKRTGRHHLNKDGDERAYLNSLGSVEANIRANEAKMRSLSTPSLSGEWVNTAMSAYHAQVNAATSNVSKYSAIRSAVIAEIHAFVVRTYYELVFSESQASLFESTRQEIDGMLAPLSGNALEKIESIYERLDEGDAEAVSQAMSTCRRLIDAFTDAVSPARDEPITVDGQTVQLKKSNVLNRLDFFVGQHTTSGSRRQRLRQAMRGIYERVSTGVHNDVTQSEARYVFLETYVLLGEILAIRESGNLASIESPEDLD